MNEAPNFTDYVITTNKDGIETPIIDIDKPNEFITFKAHVPIFLDAFRVSPFPYILDIDPGHDKAQQHVAYEVM